MLPSFYDGLPNVLVEAAALGVPLLASRAGGMADVLEDGRTALLFEPGDEAGCSWALERAVRVAGVARWRRWARRAESWPSAELDQSSRPRATRTQALPTSAPTPLRRAAP